MKIGVLGAGHLGKIHIKVIQEIAGWDLIGFYDPDDTNAANAIEKFGIKTKYPLIHIRKRRPSNLFEPPVVDRYRSTHDTTQPVVQCRHFVCQKYTL